MGKSFGTKELCKCLEKLGFTCKGIKSSHVKFNLPKNRKISAGLRPFMIVQLGKKNYDSYIANRYVSELKKLGFNKEEIEKYL